MKFLQFKMDVIAWLRYRLKEGTPLEMRLAKAHSKLLDEQMARRRAAGIQEIECQIFWGE